MKPWQSLSGPDRPHQERYSRHQSLGIDLFGFDADRAIAALLCSPQPLEQRKLVNTSGQHARRGYRMHGTKRASCVSTEQAQRFRTVLLERQIPCSAAPI
jgi:hypothetical protein